MPVFPAILNFFDDLYLAVPLGPCATCVRPLMIVLKCSSSTPSDFFKSVLKTESNEAMERPSSFKTSLTRTGSYTKPFVAIDR